MILGPFQTLNFTCVESNANERKQYIFLICIRFGTCKVRRLKRALLVNGEPLGVNGLICSTEISSFETFKLVFCIYNKLRLHAEILKCP